MKKMGKHRPKFTRDEILELAPMAIFYDDLDGAIIGVAERINLGPVVAYSIDKIIEILINDNNMSYEDVMEYFDYNIIGGWIGEETPVFIRTT